MAPDVPRLDAESFRAHAHQLVDWMTEYLVHVGDLPVQPAAEPGAVRAQIPAGPPDGPEPYERIMQDFREIIVPGLTHWGHPGFFAYFPANLSPPSILAEMLVATIGAQCMSWNTSPAATELEQVTMGWLRQMVGLPEGFTGVIQDTASTATLVALITARDRASARTATGRLDQLTVYASEHAHSSAAKGARLAGFSPEHVRLIPTDGRYAMDPAALAAAVTADRAAGRVPSAVVASVGTTSSTAIDPVRAIAAVCARERIWLHVDSAWAGSAAIVPEMRWIFDGVELADSVVFNPHKWLLVNFDCTAYFVRDTEALLRSFSTSPEFLKAAHDDRVVNYRDWGVQLGRRFRALKLWFVIRSYGVEGLRAMIREHIRLGHLLADWVEADPGFELVAPAPLALVVFRFVGRGAGRSEAELDELNARLLKALHATGRIMLTQTRLAGRYVLRFALGHLTTTEAQVGDAWALIRETAASLGR